MKIKLHALLLASAAVLIGGQTSAYASNVTHVATLQSPSKTSPHTSSGNSLSGECLNLVQSWDKTNQIAIERCLAHQGLSPQLRQKLERLAGTSAASQSQLLAQADKLTLESLQLQINALKDKINLLEVTASTSAAVAKEREQELEQTV